MKKSLLYILTFSLILSLAAPTGAVFAVEDLQIGPSQEIAALETTELEGPGESAETVDLAPSDIPSEEAVEVYQDQAENIQDEEQLELAAGEDGDNPTQLVPIKPADKTLVISYVQATGAYGKYIEIRNLSDVDYSTRSLSLLYVRSSGSNLGNPDVLATFYGTLKAGGRVTIGGSVIEQSGSQHADLYYTQAASTVMDPAGGWLMLVDDIVELDSFCWGSSSSSLCGDERYPSRNHASGTVYSRCFNTDMTIRLCGPNEAFESVDMKVATAGAGYLPFYNNCSGLVISEVAPRTLDQFIELHNPTGEAISLERCIIQINSSVYQFELDDGAVESMSYRVFSPGALGVSMARTTAGTIRLLSSEAELMDEFSYSSPPENRSAIRYQGLVVWSLKVTPGGTNEYVQYAPCEEGYWRNEETGRCNKVAAPAVPAPCRDDQYRSEETGRCRNIASARQLVPCRDGQYRSEETNRCRSIATAAASVLKPCADDQFRNPLTNRCKKIASAEEVALADCGEGRERNPATNRCRNILATTMPVAPFAPDEVIHTAQGTIGWWAFGGVSLVALGYAGWQWRFEAGRLIRRIGQVFASGGKE